MAIFALSMLCSLILLITSIVIIYLQWKLKYWQRIGLSFLNPTIPFGDTKDLITGRKNLGEQFASFYREFKAKSLRHGGVYFGLKPFYVPVDPEIIKAIMQKDFQHFVNHGIYSDSVHDPLSGHLFNLEDAEWKNMRSKITPTFTSGKMKMMFQTLLDCSVNLKEVINDSVEKNESLEIKDILGRFTTDIIGSVGFGIECNSLKNPNAPFRVYGKKVFETPLLEKFKILMMFSFPHWFLRLIQLKVTKTDVENFFMKAIKDTVTYREQNNIHRKDFIHLLLQLKNTGKITDDEEISENGKIQEIGLTLNELCAQAYLFFIGGFETSATTMTFALFELALNEDIQNKVREEVNSVLKKYDNAITYEGMMELTYMETVINETLRKYPPSNIILRQCTKDYKIPNTNICIEKGVNVGISVWGLQRDPQFYPNPEVFDPERFSEENKKTRPPFTWIPFGEGPRICIGLRFGMLEIKVGLTTLLKNYKIHLNNKTKLPLKFVKRNFITTAEGGIWLDVEKLTE